MECFARYDSPVGELILTGDGNCLTGIWMNYRVSPNAIPGDNCPVFNRTRAWLDLYFRGENPPIEKIPLAPEGTAFQQKVWKILLRIPYGETRTYGDIAREMAALLGKEKMSAQAVGQAVGRNPISILIPCHRVVGAMGQLTGYAGGLEKKTWLLRHEGWLKEEENDHQRLSAPCHEDTES